MTQTPRSDFLKDDVLLEELQNEGFDADSMRALYLIPVLDIAWADGTIQPEERKEIIGLLDRRGIQKDSQAYSLIESWLSKKPEDEKFQRAKMLVGPLFEDLKANRGAETHWIVAAAERVAQATGEKGRSPISPEERSVLTKIAKRFD